MVIKTLGSIVVAFAFFSMVLVKNATHEDEESTVDNNEDMEGHQVYPPHMWKGMAMWLGVIYAIVNLFAIARAF